MVLPFVVSELVALGGAAKFGATFIGAGTALVNSTRVGKECDVLVSDEKRAQMMLLLDSSLRCAKNANLQLTGKAHQLVHLVQRTWGRADHCELH